MPRFCSEARLVALALLLIGCGKPAPAPDLAPTPEPTPAPLASVLGEAEIDGHRVQLRVLTPEAGRAGAEAAVQRAQAEITRVASLEPGPELAAVQGVAESMAKRWGARVRFDVTGLRRAHAVDLAAMRLQNAGMTDYLVDAAVVVLVRGSQDGSHGRGWHYAMLNPDEGDETLRSARLSDRALAQNRDEGAVSSAIAVNAVMATAAAQLLAADPLHAEASREGFGLRHATAAGEVQNPEFQAAATGL